MPTPASRGQLPSDGIGPSATPRRLRSPSWLNLRLVAGVLLVLISVIVGARVLTTAESSDRVWAAATDLAAGTVLAEGDLRPVSVRLSENADAYLLSSTDPVGRVLSTLVRQGELLPRAALDEISTLVDLALPIAAGYVPPNLHRGQLVDIYALDATPAATVAQAPAAGRSGEPQDPASSVVAPVVERAVVQFVSGHTDGALSAGSSTVQVVISVRAEQAPDIFAAIAGRELALAVRSSADQPETTAPASTGDSSPTTAPTPTD